MVSGLEIWLGLGLTCVVLPAPSPAQDDHQHSLIPEPWLWPGLSQVQREKFVPRLCCKFFCGGKHPHFWCPTAEVATGHTFSKFCRCRGVGRACDGPALIYYHNPELGYRHVTVLEEQYKSTALSAQDDAAEQHRRYARLVRQHDELLRIVQDVCPDMAGLPQPEGVCRPTVIPLRCRGLPHRPAAPRTQRLGWCSGGT